GATDGFALFNFHMGGGSPDSPDATGESVRALVDPPGVVETGPGGGAMLYIALGGLAHADCEGVYGKVKSGQALGDNRACSGNDVVPAFQATPAGGWIGVAALFVENAADADATAAQFKAWLNGRAPEQLLQDARAEWERWRKPPPMGLALCSD